MAQDRLDGTGHNSESLTDLIWDVYVGMDRHAHSSEVWEECIRQGRIDTELLLGLARESGIRRVQACMKIKHPGYGVARAWKTPDGWQHLLALTADEMAFDIESDAKQVIDDAMELRKKRDVMLAFHGWAPEIPEIAKN